MEACRDRVALIVCDEPTGYGSLLALVGAWRARLAESGVTAGMVVGLQTDYSPDGCALLLALIQLKAIAVPLPPNGPMHGAELDVARVQCVVQPNRPDAQAISRREATPHPLVAELRARDTPGLVLLSSGSTGTPRAALHDMDRLLEKYTTPKRASRTLAFLLFDHIGGLNTLFHTLSSGGTLVAVTHRDPDTVCAAIARHHVQVLPTSPTFLNLLLLSDAWRRHDLSSLELITYGTEVMPQATLDRIRMLLPGVRLHQTYGLSELGILHSNARDDGSRWMKLGGFGYETRVVDGLLHIKARSAMLGYLNAETPFDADGWMNTHDEVDVDGEYIRVLGRRSDVINVGGQKVHPAEIEQVLLQAPNVLDATVRGERNPILGQIVSARLRLAGPEPLAAVRSRLRVFCAERLPAYQVPMRIQVVEDDLHSARFKKMRS